MTTYEIAAGNVSRCGVHMINHIMITILKNKFPRRGQHFLSMGKTGYASDSHLLNHVISRNMMER
jgi:hypothetical protein